MTTLTYREQHGPKGHVKDPYCEYCGGGWPCEPAILLQAIDIATELYDEIVADSGSSCSVCMTDYGHMTDCPVPEMRKALDQVARL